MTGPLYLVRHLAPEVAGGICYGRTDLACSPTLIANALPALRAALPAGAPVYSSPLRRCADLAHSLVHTVADSTADDAVTIDARLVELDFGAWEMRAWDNIPKSEVDAWAADVVHYRPGGAESVIEMATRIQAFYSDLPAGPVVVICHAGAIRLLAACGRGLAPAAMADAAAAAPNAIDYGEVVILDRV